MKFISCAWAVALALVALLSVSSTAAALPLTVSSYSMFNGTHGQYNYRDFTYTNCPGNNCDTTSAPLSGGTGKLTDGVAPALSWDQYGEDTPWVGWSRFAPNGANPTITFNFGSAVTIDSVTLWLDNTIGRGGVYLPGSVSIGGKVFAIAFDDLNPDPRAYTFSGLGIVADSVNIQLFHNTQRFWNGLQMPWVMLGEVSFDDGRAVPPVSVPEPGMPGLLGLAFGVLIFSRRRQRS